ARPGKRNLPAQLERAGVIDREPRVAVLVRVHEQDAAAVVDRALEIPLRLDDRLPAAPLDVEARNRGGVAADAGRGEERAAVGEPRGVADGCLVLVRCRVDGLAALEIDEPE